MDEETVSLVECEDCVCFTGHYCGLLFVTSGNLTRLFRRSVDGYRFESLLRDFLREGDVYGQQISYQTRTS